MKNTRNCRSL